MRRLLPVLLAALVAAPPTAAATGLPPLPVGWPKRLHLGMASQPGNAARMRATTRFKFRYQYLAGGVRTGNGWATWNEDGTFVTRYIRESRRNDITPVFTYYMIFQSKPGVDLGEPDGVHANLRNTTTMRAYFRDLALFFRRAGAFRSPVVLHVEPDMWGYGQQRNGDRASRTPVRVAATGIRALRGLPNDMSGMARAVVRLRNRLAPNVLLGYHVSVWGTNIDISVSDPPNAQVDTLARRSAIFYRSLGASFDVAFAEFDDRDSGFNEHVNGDGGVSWWNAGDFRRHVRYLSGFVRRARERVVLWQIPLGNTRMRAMDNSWGHYQDNRVQWLLADPSRDHLRAYRDAGVVAFLFGGGADGTTCACDAQGDGVTNPSPIGGNTGESLSSDDDGGFFRDRAKRYYDRAPVRVP